MELRNRSVPPPSPEKTKERTTPFKSAAPADTLANGAAEAATHALSAALSGPMLSAGPSTALDDVADYPFSELCHDGRAITSKNWLIKLWRYTIVPTKQLYLPWMFKKMPTNYLMVIGREAPHAFRGAGWGGIVILPPAEQ